MQNLLHAIFSNDTYKNYLFELKKWNYRSYLHSIDAFILGTLFARKLQLPHIERLAIGYLLHDIGKLKIPQSILQKPGRLNTREFDLMKSHILEGERLFTRIGLSDLSYLPDHIMNVVMAKDILEMNQVYLQVS